mgnify:CR=1 FL=1
MLVGVCDFPSNYAFPPYGYGGIERWLWAVALGARQAGADVHLIGHPWRPELADDWTILHVRLEDVTLGQQQARSLRDAGYDLLVVGHEYPSLSAWRRTWLRLDCDVATFQHWPRFEHQVDAFDGRRSRLYCYSEEMCQRYAAHKPIAELAVHLGLNEAELPLHETGESLRAGTPVAALAWRHGTCAQAALCKHTGSVALVDAEADDEVAAKTLAHAIEQVTVLSAHEVQEIGLDLFAPARHFQALATRPC